MKKMKISSSTRGFVLGVCLACFVAPGLKAQTATADSPATPTGSQSKQTEALKMQVQTDQAQTPAPATPQTPPAPAAAPAPAAPAPLPTPAITGPLSGAPPLVFDAGPFGKLSVNGIISG